MRHIVVETPRCGRKRTIQPRSTPGEHNLESNTQRVVTHTHALQLVTRLVVGENQP